MRIYAYRELCELFGRAGLADCEGYDTKSFGERSAQRPNGFLNGLLALVGTKRG